MDPKKYDLVESPLLATTMAAASHEYWTAAKVAAVRPIPLRKIHRPAGTAAPAALAAPAVGRTLMALPTPPKSASLTASGVSNADTQKVADMTAMPFCFVGKLRMTFAEGDFQGSAWVIGKKAILTAGHCVFDKGFASNIQFQPQMRGSQAAGTYSVVKMTTTREFADNDNLVFDIGAGILDRPIDDVTGVCGYVVNPNPLGGKLVGIGYPARRQDGFPFDGQEMWRSIGDVASDQAPGTTADRNYGMFNDMSGGCSGGPWFTATAPAMAIGLNSHIFTDTAGNPSDVPRQMRSPYFGAAFLRILNWIKENGGEPNEPNLIGGGGDVHPPQQHDHAALEAQLQAVIDSLGGVKAALHAGQ